MPHGDPIERILALRYSVLTPWVKAARLGSPDGSSACSLIQTFIEDELPLWIPERSPWSQLASSSWWPLDSNAALRDVSTLFATARERAIAFGTDFWPEAWAAAEEARAIFADRLFHPVDVQYFTNRSPSPAAKVPVPAIAATDGRHVGVLWLEVG
jgi:hypothetical protein